MEKVAELEKEKKALETKFAENESKLKETEEKRKTAEAELKKKTEEFAEQERKRKIEAAERAADAFCEKQLQKGFITPAQIAAGLTKLLVFADLLDAEAVIKFGESEKKPGDILRDVLSQTQILEFKEVAKPEPEKETDIAKFGELAKKAGVTVREYREACNKVAAFSDKRSPMYDPKMTPEAYIEANPKEFASLGKK